jgi:hypothetical protein
VRINDAGCVTGFERAWNGVWGNLERILSVVSEAFETKFFSYQEPEYYGLYREEERAAWRSKQTDLEKWLAIRKAEALKIDPDTAEVGWELRTGTRSIRRLSRPARRISTSRTRIFCACSW